MPQPQSVIDRQRRPRCRQLTQRNPRNHRSPRLRRRNPHIVTRQHEPGSRDVASAAYLVKPFSAAQLQAAVHLADAAPSRNAPLLEEALIS